MQHPLSNQFWAVASGTSSVSLLLMTECPIWWCRRSMRCLFLHAGLIEALSANPPSPDTTQDPDPLSLQWFRQTFPSAAPCHRRDTVAVRHWLEDHMEAMRASIMAPHQATGLIPKGGTNWALAGGPCLSDDGREGMILVCAGITMVGRICYVCLWHLMPLGTHLS